MMQPPATYGFANRNGFTFKDMFFSPSIAIPKLPKLVAFYMTAYLYAEDAAPRPAAA
jgi:hypothetical protein